VRDNGKGEEVRDVGQSEVGGDNQRFWCQSWGLEQRYIGMKVEFAGILFLIDTRPAIRAIIVAADMLESFYEGCPESVMVIQKALREGYLGVFGLRKCIWSFLRCR
jgi:hypothetical protein